MNEVKMDTSHTGSFTQSAVRGQLRLFILASVLAWTVFLCVARYQGAVWDDMLETWAWARQPQLGYYKHPPFYAWVVAGWFKLFPRQDWAFYLLAMANVGMGYAGVYALARRFVAPALALAAVLLLSFTPWTTYMASNFNANTILLSIWPWTAYAFVRSLEPGAAGARIKWGTLFGALAAAALLSKYFSILLLASCFVASLMHPNAREYYRSPAPYLAALACMALCAPHAWWSVVNEFPPIRYAMAKTVSPPGRNIYKAITTGLASLAMCSGALVALAAANSWQSSGLRAGFARLKPDRASLWIWILAAGPFLLTVALGLAGSIKIATNFMIPVFFMAPVLIVMALANTDAGRWLPRLNRIALGVLAAAVLASPVIGYASMRANIKGTSDVSPEAAREATRLWHEAFNTPVKIAYGTEKFSIALPFYSPDNPAEFTHFDFGQAPWITPERIKAEGLLAVCSRVDLSCVDFASKVANARTRTVARQLTTSAWGQTGKPVDLVIIMTPGTMITERLP
jgi:4-amino-4-deoxy-L-arabinose transferase-like glycosyltransferase